MKATQKLHELGQSVWLDNITRDLLTSGTLRRYIDELSLTGLTSNPTIFDQAIKSSSDYDSAIRGKLKEGKSGESLFFELAIEDLAQAADLFRPTWDRTNGVDGWVSLEVSPLLAHDTASTIAAAKELHARAKRPNLFIKIPGTKEGLPAIEETIFAGVPVNVTLLFSRLKSKCWLRCVGLRQPLGCRCREQSARALAQSARHRDRQTNIQDSLRVTRLGTLAAYLQRGWAATAPAMGEHGNQGSRGVRRPIRQGAGRAAHREHHAGRHGEGPRRSRRDWRDVAARWRRFRRGTLAIRKSR